MYQCAQLSTPDPNGVQTCIAWAEAANPLAITHDQMIQISTPLLAIAGLFIAYAVVARAIKLL